MRLDFVKSVVLLAALALPMAACNSGSTDSSANAETSASAQSSHGEPADPVAGNSSNASAMVAITAGPPADATLAAYQKDLLKLAFGTATKIPIYPHIKDRCKTQEAVVQAALKLDQPATSLDYLKQIVDWRRAGCYADLASYCVEKNHLEPVDEYLKIATTIADETDTQDWRKDNIRVRVARAYALSGDMKRAENMHTGVEHSESGKLAGTQAMVADDAAFEEQMKNIDQLLAANIFDVTRNALESCVSIVDRYYTNEDQRARAEAKIKASWNSMPIIIRLDLVTRLAEIALKHKNLPAALVLVNEAQTYVREFDWDLEDKIGRAARLTALRFQAGDADKARADANELRELYNQRGKSIVNIWRAGALRPLAEAYAAMGDRDAALAIYKLAVEEGYENPNSRPRAEDLSATCCSLAVNAFEPDAELSARIHGIYEGLAEPW